MAIVWITIAIVATLSLLARFMFDGLGPPTQTHDGGAVTNRRRTPMPPRSDPKPGRYGGKVLVVASLAAVWVALLPVAAAYAAVPGTVPTGVATSGTVGSITLTADSTAALVQFQVDSETPLTPVQVTNGVATAQWVSWGRPNGSHMVIARDCDALGSCGTPSAPVTFQLTNTAATILAPVSGSTVRGGFTITAHFPGGQLRLLLDGRPVGSPTSTSPYSYAYRGTLPAGSHTLRANQCALNGSVCAGPATQIGFRTDGLHPALTSVSPSPFSPNGDRYRDTTTAALYLSESQTVALRILNAGHSIVRSVSLGTLASGSHTWIWNGKTASGSRLADGVYLVQLTSSKIINGVTVTGAASRMVTLDTTAPVLYSMTGSGTTFYPYPDGFRDTFASGITLSGAGTLRLTVYDPTNHAIRIIQSARNAGRTAFVWNGTNSGGHLVAAGTYTFAYSITDSAGNHRSTSRGTVVVSRKRLLARSVTYTRNANTFYKVTGNNSYCVQYDTGISSFSHGVWLDNVCDPDPTYGDGYSVIEAHYIFTIPGAVKYASASASAYGSTLYPPSGILAAYFDASGNFINAGFNKAGGSNTWLSLGSMSGAHISGGRIHFAIGVDDSYNAVGGSSDFDMGTVKLIVRYYVLG